MPWAMLLRCPWFHADTRCTCQRRTSYVTGDLLIFGNVELATQNLIHWHCLTSVTKWCAKEGDGCAWRSCCARANNLHPPWLAKLSKGCNFHRARNWAETYTITYPHDTPNIDCPPCPCPSLDRLLHVREVDDLFGVGSSLLTPAPLGYSAKRAPPRWGADSAPLSNSRTDGRRKTKKRQTKALNKTNLKNTKNSA